LRLPLEGTVNAHIRSLIPNRKANGSAMQALIKRIRRTEDQNAHLQRRESDGEVSSGIIDRQKCFTFA
jgi:hypothetical protein